MSPQRFGGSQLKHQLPKIVNLMILLCISLSSIIPAWLLYNLGT